MMGITVEPRMIVLMSRGGNRSPLRLETIPMQEARFSSGSSRGARLYDELYMGVDRLRGLSLPPAGNNAQFAKFVLNAGPFPIFPTNIRKDEIFLNKQGILTGVLTKYFEKKPGLRKRVEDKLGYLRIPNKRVPDTSEIWLEYDPRDMSKRRRQEKEVRDKASRLRFDGLEVEKDLYKHGYIPGVIPIGIVFRVRLYYKNIPTTIHNRPTANHYNTATTHVRGYLPPKPLSANNRSRRMETQEWWSPVAILPNRFPEAITMTNRGMEKVPSTAAIEIRVHKVLARNAEHAKRLLKTYYYHKIKNRHGEDNTVKAERAYKLYLGWEANGFKVVPYSGTNNYREINHQ